MCVCVWNVIAYDVDDDIEMRWMLMWWWHWDEMMLILMMILRWDDVHVMMTLRWNDVNVDDVIVMYVCCLCTWGCSDHVGYFRRGKKIGLTILSIPGETRGFLRVFNYPRSVHWWCPCFIRCVLCMYMGGVVTLLDIC